MAIAIILIVLVVGSVVFHFMSPWYFTEIASNWTAIDTTVTITFIVCGIVFVAANLFMAYCIIKYRNKDKNQRADYEPENKKLEGWLTAITTVGVVAMLAPGLIVWGKFVSPPENAAIVEVVGQQWQWTFRFPGKDGQLGTTDNRKISIDNPFGMNDEDPYGQDDVLIEGNEVHIPIGLPIKFLLRSKDVLHNFTVPQFRVKMDLVPGMITWQWLTPTRVGTFEILCEELCGIGHHSMRGKVTVVEEEQFHEWLAQQPTYAMLAARQAGNAQAGQAQYQICAACHGVQGEGNQALNAPKLSGQEDWYLTRQLTYFRDGIRGSNPEDVLGQQMAPMAAGLVNDTLIRDLAAYIQTLPDEPAQQTVQGDVDNGKDLYTTCGKCHGKKGEGRWAVNAPRLAGMSDWYLAAQLRNFKHGIRGAHPQDATGRQMESMVLSLSDKTIDDLVAYINTF
ncbi:MAG: cytochrome c oxidase subunit II [Proteobacteria bacterium]|nr:cytochrome c oxidase subunit II [Pseudomonadota bacterium]